MSKPLSNVVLRVNTALFAQKVCECLMSLTPHRFEIDAPTLNKGAFTYPGGQICTSHFSGEIQGDYFIACSEETAFKTATPKNRWTKKNFYEIRAQYGEFFKELLNTAIGGSLAELEKIYGRLTQFSPSIIHGEIETPVIQSGTVIVRGEPGDIQCTVSINMVSLRLRKS